MSWWRWCEAAIHNVTHLDTAAKADFAQKKAFLRDLTEVSAALGR